MVTVQIGTKTVVVFMCLYLQYSRIKNSLQIHLCSGSLSVVERRSQNLTQFADFAFGLLAWT